ncbi:AraC family transcriptional regulator [Phenylobacterium sp.]|uniref:AraC family transcriptional regulator n=1 Tax=Phenylobacterium sp. TaxID=1871053 RepID=UPI0035B42120
MREPPSLTRSASLTGFAEVVRALGLDPYRLTTEAGLPAASLSDPDLRVSAAAVGRVLERAAREANAPDLGLRMAETRRLSNLGVVGLVARDQPTLRRALDVMVGYSWAQNEAVALSLAVHGDVAVLREGAPGARPGGQGTLLNLGVITGAIRQLVGRDWRPQEVWLTGPPPDDLSTHRRVFGVTPRFDQDFNGLVIAARDLDRPVVGADPVMAERALRYVAAEAGDRPRRVADAVRNLILALLPAGDCTVERVCRHLDMDRRTLHRRLAAEGEPTFTELLQAARIELARRYLAAGRYSMTEIAERLGYGSLSAFSRWRRGQLSRLSVPSPLVGEGGLAEPGRMRGFSARKTSGDG